MSTSLNGWPGITVKAWPASSPTDGSMPATAPTDLAPRTQKLTVTRGRQYELDTDQVGTCSLAVRNDDGLFGPKSKFQPAMPMQVTATLNGGTYNLFTGYWESLPWSQPSPLEGTAQLTAQDLAGAWANRTLQSSMTEYVMASSPAPTFYHTGGGAVPPLVGTPSATTMWAANWSANMTTTFLGDTALNYSSATGVTLMGALNQTGSTWLARNAPIALTVGFTVNASTDVFPIVTLGDANGNPLYALFYRAGVVEARCYTGTNNSMSSAVFSSVATSVGAGLHIATFTHDGKLMVLHVDGSNTVTSPGVGWPVYGIRQWALGTPYSLTKGSTLMTSGYSSTNTWNASGNAIYGLALYSNTTTTATQWQRIAYAESQGSSTYFTVPAYDVSAWAGTMTPQFVPNQNVSPSIFRTAVFGQTLLGYAQEIMQGVAGRFFVNSSGVPIFMTRDAYQLPGPVKWAFGAQAGEYPYTGSPEFSYDLTRVATEVTVSSPAGNATVASTATRFAQRRSMQVSSQTTDPWSQAGWLLGRYETPTPRPSALRFEPSANPALWPMVLGAELGDLVKLNHRSPGAGQSVSMLGHIESISHEIDATAGTWVTTISISPNLGSYWVLDDSAYSILGSTTALNWSTSS